MCSCFLVNYASMNIYPTIMLQKARAFLVQVNIISDIFFYNYRSQNLSFYIRRPELWEVLDRCMLKMEMSLWKTNRNFFKGELQVLPEQVYLEKQIPIDPEDTHSNKQNGRTDRHTDRHTHEHTDRFIHGYNEIHTDGQTDRHTDR